MKKTWIFVVASVCSIAGCAHIDEANGPYVGMYEDFSKATSFNLAQAVNNPKHITEPEEIGLPNSQAAVGAVDRYQRGNVRDIDNEIGSASSGVGSK